MVSELVKFKGHLPIYAPSPKSVGREGGVSGKTQVEERVNFVDLAISTETGCHNESLHMRENNMVYHAQDHQPVKATISPGWLPNNTILKFRSFYQLS